MVRLLESEMKALTAPALTTFALVLAACGGSSGSSSNGGASYDSMYARGFALGDKIDDAPLTSLSGMPTEGRATYSGVAGFRTSPESEDYDVVAEAALIANFNNQRVAGQLSNFRDDENNAIAGTVEIERDRLNGNEFTNTLSGTLVADGEELVVDGQLTGGFAGPDAGFILGDITGTVGGQYVEGELVAERQ
jgi:hypothetical protein